VWLPCFRFLRSVSAHREGRRRLGETPLFSALGQETDWAGAMGTRAFGSLWQGLPGWMAAQCGKKCGIGREGPRWVEHFYGRYSGWPPGRCSSALGVCVRVRGLFCAEGPTIRAESWLDRSTRHFSAGSWLIRPAITFYAQNWRWNPFESIFGRFAAGFVWPRTVVAGLVMQMNIGFGMNAIHDHAVAAASFESMFVEKMMFTVCAVRLRTTIFRSNLRKHHSVSTSISFP